MFTFTIRMQGVWEFLPQAGLLTIALAERCRAPVLIGSNRKWLVSVAQMKAEVYLAVGVD